MNLETHPKSIFSTAKKQKLKECMEDEDHCPNTFGPCNPEHTDQCIDLVGKGMSYTFLIFFVLRNIFEPSINSVLKLNVNANMDMVMNYAIP